MMLAHLFHALLHSVYFDYTLREFSSECISVKLRLQAQSKTKSKR